LFARKNSRTKQPEKKIQWIEKEINSNQPLNPRERDKKSPPKKPNPIYDDDWNEFDYTSEDMFDD
jgi:hypothetical protein